MTDRDRRPDETREDDTAGRGGETFKREGPEPADRDTGSTVEEMNEIARDALLRNIRPDPSDDDDRQR
jgi:hypothetical protein